MQKPTPRPIGFRVGFFAYLAIVAASCSVWRVHTGNRPLPGLFSVFCIPLAVALFVWIDRRAGFSPSEWIAVGLLVSAHLVFSVPFPSLPGVTIYSQGLAFIRIDRLVHIGAGGVVAWLCRDALRRGFPNLSSRTASTVAVALAIGLGAAKVATDLISVRMSRTPFDGVDAAFDMAANALGALGATLWRQAGERRTASPTHREPPPAERLRQ